MNDEITIFRTVTAWRGWKLEQSPEDPPSLRLRSLVSPMLWTPFAEMEAVCDRTFAQVNACEDQYHKDNEGIPSFSGQCGFYGYPDESLGSWIRDHPYSNGIVVGQVDFWGEVIECKEGYRAECAYPRSLAWGVCGVCNSTFSMDSLIVTPRAKSSVKGFTDSTLMVACRSHLLPSIISPDWFRQLAGGYGIAIVPFDPSIHTAPKAAL